MAPRLPVMRSLEIKGAIPEALSALASRYWRDVYTTAGFVTHPEEINNMEYRQLNTRCGSLTHTTPYTPHQYLYILPTSTWHTPYQYRHRQLVRFDQYYPDATFT